MKTPALKPGLAIAPSILSANFARLGAGPLGIAENPAGS